MNYSQDDTVIDDIRIISEKAKDTAVYFIFPSIFFGGHEIMAIEIIKKIANLGEGVDNIICLVPEDNEKIMAAMLLNSINHKTYKASSSKPEFLHAFFNPFYFFRCVSILNSIPKRSEIILVQGDILQGVGFVLAAKLLSKKLISYIPYAHSFRKMGAKLAKIKDFFAFGVYKACNQYITISECFKQEIETKNKSAIVSVIHNFVPKESENFATRKLNSDDPISVFIVGRVQFHQKGHDILINALSGITEYKLALHVVGDGPDMNNLRIMGHKLPKNISIDFHGWVTDSWRIAQEKNIDFLVIPSLFEGVPLVMLEALERNVSIIAAGRDGMLDYLPIDSLYEVSGDEVTALREKIIYHIQKRSK
ncbi:glycosyl transferase group 1 [Serratia sp. AS12]|uniref:glycosyltransferase family 4 protein n=1 Tax=Serratia TaxID=613 RepID=UPI00020E989E|nr:MULTISPECIES: glycosyltransferase family 4 protein [Serratia]AEF44690.1 glycosyl transferase group 1 [Serratia plymuthica AS9]AEF49642.1 glycosyl transferase group 1 [Serratia sp. AS12]AEG27349.1 glycosyl transferase group 1 [Serratia sp. AS13]UTN98191.1 glycosyltransferase family 4 protein [Serratia plymuthica]